MIPLVAMYFIFATLGIVVIIETVVLAWRGKTDWLESVLWLIIGITMIGISLPALVYFTGGG